ncbi:rhombosortase [Thiofilum flexile]|uniref:rhombosortase n=1 Tax=Thiofilum flexile TaxID=125627 RepID=UPI0003659AE5|nr:rhombosortase [Thiofilum flexile]
MPFIFKTYGSILVLSLVLVVAQWSPEWLYYERTKLAQGELWRLVSGHFTHSNAAHLSLNLVGFWLWRLLQPATLPQHRILSLSLLLALIISLLFWFTLPQLHWYVGFSGILYSLFGAWVGYLLYTREYLIGSILGLTLIGKTLWDATHPDNLSQQLIAVPVVYQAHLYGLALSPLSTWYLYRRIPAIHTQA